LQARYTGLVFLLLFLPALLPAQTVTTGKSYINITRPNGGTFLPGDIIEVRATIAVTGGSSASNSRVNAIRYNDTINLAKFTYVANSLRMLSNEGRLQVQYTDANDADSANITTANGYLRFNIGSGSGSCSVAAQGTGTTNAGSLWGALRPSFYGGTCIRMYSYRIQIRNTPSVVDIDTLVKLNAGNFRYRMGSSSTDQLSDFPPYLIRIAPDYGLCSNAIGTNAILGENGGSFGSGAAQNRAGGTTFVPAPYSFLNFGANAPNDNYYGLANRTSADGSTNGNLTYPHSSRVFSVWDIIGDHTGAVNQAAGNPPTNQGYAVIINASYETNRAFTQTISNLCEETYYEFSAWFRNICRRCGCDSSGKGAGSAGYVPGPGNDSSGVRPNLNFQIDGEDYYTSGNIAYTGQWVKKGFVFRTKPGQTSFTVTIRNNAPGGGGNDWAIDDIAVATCLPNMRYSPSITPTICRGSPLTLRDTVRSYFDNYNYYQWQRSTDGGASWTNLGAPAGPVIPYWNGVSWEYVSTYIISPANTTLANNGDLYRLIVATSLSNLSNVNCRSTDNMNIVTLTVLECGIPLATELISFTAKNVNDRAKLEWTTGMEEEDIDFTIEKSSDGISFEPIHTLHGYSNHSAIRNQYVFTDPGLLTAKQYYRIRMYNASGRSSYSRVQSVISESKGMQLVSCVNPFSGQVKLEVVAERESSLLATLSNAFGQPVASQRFSLRTGSNSLTITDLDKLASGMYILSLQEGEKLVTRKLVKR